MATTKLQKASGFQSSIGHYKIQLTREAFLRQHFKICNAAFFLIGTNFGAKNPFTEKIFSDRPFLARGTVDWDKSTICGKEFI
jgi:hypothetical protein